MLHIFPLKHFYSTTLGSVNIAQIICIWEIIQFRGALKLAVGFWLIRQIRVQSVCNTGLSICCSVLVYTEDSIK